MAQRLHGALVLREQITSVPYYRLVHGEGDGLPGLIIDRYDRVLVVQITTAGMEALKSLLLEALQELLQPRGILLRNENGARELEGLSQDNATIGTIDDTSEIQIGRALGGERVGSEVEVTWGAVV